MNDATHPAIPAVLIWVAVGIAILARFGLRELRDRKIRLGRLFVVPAVVGAIAALLVTSAALAAPTRVVELAGLSIVALGVGCGVGLAVARFTTLRLGPEPGTVLIRGSYATLAIWIGALALRALARLAVGGHDLGATAVANAALLVLLAAAIAMFRYRILIDARAASASGIAAELTAV